MTTCGREGKRIIEFFEGGLGASDRRDLLSHIAQCPRCRLEYEKHTKLYRIMREDEVVFPPDGVFEHIKRTTRRSVSGPAQVKPGRALRFVIPATAAAIILLVVLWPRNKTVEFSVPVATLIEDADIASVAVMAVVDEEMAHDLSTIEYYLLPETEQAIDELTVDEKIEFVNSLQERYHAGT